MVLAAGSWYASATIWTIILTAAGVAAAVVFGILTISLQRPRRRLLVYTAEGRPLLAGPSAALQNPDLKVIYGGTPTSTPHLVSFSVLSKSRTDIRRDDFDGQKPLIFDLGTPIVALLASAPPGKNGRAGDWFKIDGNAVNIGPVLIRSGQTIKLDLLTNAPPHVDLQNNLAGVTLIEEKGGQQGTKRRKAVVGAVAALVVASSLATGLVVHVLASPGASRTVINANTLPDMALVNSQQPAKPPQISSTLSVLTDHASAGIHSVAYSPNGEYLAAGDANGHFYIWNVASGKLIDDLYDQNPVSLGVYAVAFSKNGEYFATGDGNGDVYLWSQSFALIRVLTDAQHAGGIRALAFSDSNKYLAAGDDSGHIYVWSIPALSLENIQHDQNSDGVDAAAFNTGSSDLVAGDSNGQIYFWGQPHVLKVRFPDPHSGGVRALAFSEDNHLAAGDANGNSFVFSTVTNGNTVTYGLDSNQTVSESCGVDAVAFSPDENYLAAGDADGHLYLWAKVLSGAQQLILQSESSDFSETGAITAVAFSSDGRHLAAGSSNGRLYQFNAQF
jgi:WD40 repeat protein